jgi:hypothetical protein
MLVEAILERPTIEHRLNSNLICNPEFFKQLPNIKKEFFQETGNRIVFEMIAEYAKEFHKPPNKQTLLVELVGTGHKDDDFEAAEHAILRLSENPDDTAWCIKHAEALYIETSVTSAAVKMITDAKAGKGIDLTELEALKTVNFRNDNINALQSSDFSLGEWDTYSDLIETIIPSGPAVGFLTGKSSTGKSFVEVNMAASIARGRPWCGFQTEKANTLIISGEGSAKLSKRVLGHELRYGKGDLAGVRFHADQWNMADPADCRKAIAYIKKYDIKLTFLDTLGQMLKGSDSKDEDVKPYLRGMDYVAKETGAVVIAVHHPPKAGTSKSKGSADLRNAVDFQIDLMEIERGESFDKIVPDAVDDEVYLVLTCEKSKDDRDDWKVPLVRKPITLIEKNQKGFSITTCIIEPTDKIKIAKLKSSDKGPPKLNTAGQLVYNILKTTFHGLCPSKDVLLQHAKPMMEEEGYKPDTARQYVLRGLKELTDDNLVVINRDGFIVLGVPNDPFKHVTEDCQ